MFFGTKQKPISLDEQKAIRLEILIAVDRFCRDNNIRYSLAFGTLLGAVRHQGFIPWDDDLDIMMPLPDMLRFKKEFTSDKIKYCDIDTEPHFRSAFANLGYNSTYRRSGLIGRYFGVEVDIYPLIGIPEEQNERALFFNRAASLQLKREKALLWNAYMTKVLPIRAIPCFDKTIKEYRDYLYNNSISYEKSKSFYVIAGPLALKEKMIYECDLFQRMTDLVFEGMPFLCIENYDLFLSLRYGDYMQLPPTEDRVPHHGQTYFRK